MNLFLKIIKPNKNIYIKVDILVHFKLHDAIHDMGYKMEKCTPAKWDYEIENGLSYEMDTLKELKVFIKNNIKKKKYRTYEI